MLIHLMQHGACLPKEVNSSQPLSPVGREQVEKTARSAAMLGLRFELVVASSKVRSLQTAEIMASKTGYPVDRIVVSDAVKAMAPTAETLKFILDYEGLDSMLIVGHLPSLGLLASALLSPGKNVDIRVENGGLMQFNFEPGKAATLNWAMTPAQLAVMAGS
ncbi:histidine phosphatase family protein [uncultured Pseudodesulfovibrio sp.]|uniref:SixA phosphatase family protein n=1 Tax=uncultured Pseudodesulfovibrio sp. TaxID=2035858 RepID=UPI0029C75510|nr:histidine phosphatase family protein [uncultured Pseudodesulfovibrio sp.]